MRIGLFVIFLIVKPTIIYADKCSDLIDCLRKKELSSIKLELEQLSSYDELMVNWQIDFLKEFNISIKNSDFFENNKPTDLSLGSVYYYINKGDFLYHNFVDKNIDALSSYKKALDQAGELKNQRLECEVIKKILWVHRITYLYRNDTYKDYITYYKSVVYDDFEMAYYHYFNLIFKFENYYVHRWDSASFKWLETYLETHDVPFLKAVSHQVFASYFEELGEFDKVNNSIRIMEEQFKKIPYGFIKNRRNQQLVFGARIAAKEKEFLQLQSYLSDVDTATYNKSNYQYQSIYFYYLSVSDTFNRDFRSAWYHYYEYDKSQDSLRTAWHNDKQKELETKYQAEKKEKENIEKQRKILSQEKQLLIEKESKVKTRTVAIILAIILVLGLIIGALVYRESKRKRLFAIQEKNIQSEKVTNLLKEQELIALNSMIEGQEQERKRIAEDLHDRLGSTLSAVKMHMDVLSENDARYDKINRIVDKAVNDTREIAHNMLSGVLTKFGLMAALQDLKETLESSNQFKVNLRSIQFDERLDSETEIHIYRILQELISNTLKHAKATQVDLELKRTTDKGLTITYKDNGKGFDPEVAAGGMGLKNIKNRIDKLEGYSSLTTAPMRGVQMIIELWKIT